MRVKKELSPNRKKLALQKEALSQIPIDQERLVAAGCSGMRI